MFNNYDPNIKATIILLKELAIKVNNQTVNETLQNHPNWPSLLCISDSLKKWNIPNGAGLIENHKIDEVPTPFIAHTDDIESPLAIITKITNSKIEGYQKNYSKKFVEEKEEFINRWNGVYLFAEPKEDSGEDNYNKYRRKYFFNSLIPIATLIAIICLSFTFLNNKIIGYPINPTISIVGIYFQFLILLLGIIITTLLLWYEIDKNNPLLQKVCNGIVKGNCSAVLSSKKSKLFYWLSWSEVGFFYFSGGFLLLLFLNSTIERSLSILSIINILALPYIVFSIYYQWKVAKQWCILCLGVQALLLLGGLNILLSNLITTFFKIPIIFFINSLLIYLLPILIWYSIKPYILKLQEAKITKREFLRVKFNVEIFETLLKKQKEVKIPDELGINIGNPEATNLLLKVCNPYCDPCAKAHPKIEKLLEEIPNLKVKIIFTTPNKIDERGFNPVSHLLAIYQKNNDGEYIKQALDDWYLPEKKDYERFANKYPVNGEIKLQGAKIAAMDKWCKEFKLYATPSIFINNYKLPNAYSIEDLEYLLLE